jgi:hypothetical protein
MSDTKSNFSLILSVASLLISVGGFMLGFFNFHRDKEKLQIDVKLKKFVDDIAPPEVEIVAANSGRRHIILLELGMDYDDGGWRTVYLNDKDGILLKEKERFTVSQEKLETLLYNFDSDATAIKIWFRDSLNKVHRAKEVRGLIQRFYQEVSVRSQPRV